MTDCREIRDGLVEALRDATRLRDPAVRTHLEGCAGCRQALDELRAAWEAVPTSSSSRPPGAARRKVLAYARERPTATVAEPPEAPTPRRVWSAVRSHSAPVAVGTAAAAAIVGLMHVRDGLAPDGGLWLVVLTLGLAAGLALAAAGIHRGIGGTYRMVRAVLLASVAGLAGYVALTLMSPIPDTVEFCRLAFLGGADVSRGDLCLLYVGVAALYAALPVGLAAYRWADPRRRWRFGLTGALLFGLLSLPVLGLQMGTADWILTLSALGGVAAGAGVGGLMGSWAAARRVAGA